MNWLSWQFALALVAALTPAAVYLAVRQWAARARWFIRAPQGVSIGPFRSRDRAAAYIRAQHLDGHYTPVKYRPPRR